MTPVSGIAPDESPFWMWNFTLMAILVGINHGVEDLFYAYTTVIYPGDLGYDCNTLLYLVWSVSSMLLAAPVATQVGSKLCISLGLSLYCVQYVCFVLCSAISDTWYMPWVAYTGAVNCGVGAGLLWTAQGVYLA